MKSSYTAQLPNLLMLGSDSTTTLTHTNVNNAYLVSLRKTFDKNCEVKLTKNQYTFHKDNTPIMITPTFFKKWMHVMDLKQSTLRNESKERKSLANSSIE